jgi:ATP/maltotriose-dependent transcriptional regulator MalT
LSAGAIKFLGKINVQLLADLKSKQGNTLQVESTSALLETLTKRERQMIDAIVTGETNKEIAEKLFISEQTVKWHIHQLYQKFGVKNRASAIAKATALSLI